MPSWMRKLVFGQTVTTQDGWADDGDDTNGPIAKFATPQVKAVDNDSDAFAQAMGYGSAMTGANAIAPPTANRLATCAARLKAVTTVQVLPFLGLIPWRFVVCKVSLDVSARLQGGRGDALAVAWLFDLQGAQVIGFQRSYHFERDPTNPQQILVTPGNPMTNPGGFTVNVTFKRWLAAGPHVLQIELSALPVAERWAAVHATLNLDLD